MNQVFETQRPAKAATKARAKNAIRKAEQLLSIESPKALQVQRLRSTLNCSEAVAYTLAALAYGEGRS